MEQLTPGVETFAGNTIAMTHVVNNKYEVINLDTGAYLEIDLSTATEKDFWEMIAYCSGIINLWD